MFLKQLNFMLILASGKFPLKIGLAGDKATLSYTGQKLEKMIRTKNKEHFCGSRLTDMLNISPPSYQKTLRAHLNESQYLTLQLLLLGTSRN